MISGLATWLGELDDVTLDNHGDLTRKSGDFRLNLRGNISSNRVTNSHTWMGLKVKSADPLGNSFEFSAVFRYADEPQ